MFIADLRADGKPLDSSASAVRASLAITELVVPLPKRGSSAGGAFAISVIVAIDDGIPKAAEAYAGLL